MSAPDAGRRRPARATVVRGILGLLAGVGGLLLVSRLDLPTIGATLRSADLQLVTIAVLLNLAYFLVRGARWWLLLQTVAVRVSPAYAVRMSSVGVLMSSLYPGLGEVARLVMLRQRAAPTAAAAAVLEERLLDMAVFGALLLVAMAASPPALALVGSFNAVGVGVIAAVVLGALLGLGLVMRLSRWGDGVRHSWNRGFSRFLPHHRLKPRFQEYDERIAGCSVRRQTPSDLTRKGWLAAATRPVAGLIGSFRASGRAMIRQPTLALAIAVTTLLAHALAIAVGWVALSAFGASASALTVLTLVVLINLGLGLLPSPAGLGLYQAAGLAVLASAATSPELAVAAATGLQAVNYGATLLAALLSLLPERWTAAPRRVPLA